jgi:hypothetical protein
MAVAARQGKMALAGVSVKAMRNNAQLYENGINTTAKQYMETVDRKFVVIDAKLRNGKKKLNKMPSKLRAFF